MKIVGYLILLVVSFSTSVWGQERVIFTQGSHLNPQYRDSTEQKPIKYVTLNDVENGIAFRIFINTFGFGIGGIYRHQFNDEFAYQLEIELAGAKEDRNVEYIDQWTGLVYSPTKINSLLMIPITNALTGRLFKEDILDNFRPYYTIGAGPIIAYSFPYEPNSLTGLGSGNWHLGWGGYLGFGADFGTNFTLIQGVNIRYIFQHLPNGVVLIRNPDNPIEVKSFEYFHGFSLSLNIGRMWPK